MFTIILSKDNDFLDYALALVTVFNYLIKKKLIQKRNEALNVTFNK